MRIITQAALAVGFVGAMAISAPVTPKAQELCIGICIVGPANADNEDRGRRNYYYSRYSRNYDNYEYDYYGSYDSYQAYLHRSYYRHYYDKWNGSSTQYRSYNRAYDFR